jgi:hypothetical protein
VLVRSLARLTAMHMHHNAMIASPFVLDIGNASTQLRRCSAASLFFATRSGCQASVSFELSH